jgi:hypothetical protein
MRVLAANLATYIAETLASVKLAVETARDAGLVAELPDKVDFQNVEVVFEEQAFEDLTTEEDSKQQTTESTKPATTVTTNKSGGGQVHVETQSSQTQDTQQTLTDHTQTTTLSY